NLFGKNLQALRTQRGLTQLELAKMLKINVKSVKNWENGISNPNIESLFAVMDKFHLSADELLGTKFNHDCIVLPNNISSRDRKVLRDIISAVIQSYCNSIPKQ
ncbi:MAG: helix-turn-helix transcriptional regulator, partial [Prevotella sp.]|nr:helix-turn-helix transcriptional regulator [Prevotella sp.]